MRFPASNPVDLKEEDDRIDDQYLAILRKISTISAICLKAGKWKYTGGNKMRQTVCKNIMVPEEQFGQTVCLILFSPVYTIMLIAHFSIYLLYTILYNCIYNFVYKCIYKIYTCIYSKKD